MMKKIRKAILCFFKGIKNDIKNYNKNNTSERAVFDCTVFARYKGALVIKTPFDASFSYGFIGLSRKQQNENTIKHEYGHILQWRLFRPWRFTLDVAIPSLTLNMLFRFKEGFFDYYGAPWEAEADRLGEVERNRNNIPWPKGVYNSYLDLWHLFK